LYEERAVNEQTIDQQTEEASFEAASFTYEVSDEALEAVGERMGMIEAASFTLWGCRL
jgi:hypothetical protein